MARQRAFIQIKGGDMAFPAPMFCSGSPGWKRTSSKYGHGSIFMFILVSEKQNAAEERRGEDVQQRAPEGPMGEEGSERSGAAKTGSRVEEEELSQTVSPPPAGGNAPSAFSAPEWFRASDGCFSLGWGWGRGMDIGPGLSGLQVC